jgi:hypothetical protein
MKPVDPLTLAAARRYVKWVPFSYVALIGGVVWMLYARGHWPGSRGLLLGASGMLIAIALSGAGSLSFIKAIEAGRRFLGLHYSTFYVGGIVLVVLSAVLLLILGVVQPAD